MNRPLLLAAILAAAPACTTTTATAPPGLQNAVVHSVPVERAWIVSEGGTVVGSFLRYGESVGSQRFLYVVRNVHHQDLGMVDQLGRAIRYRPHAEPEWLGTGTLQQGVCRVLGLGQDAELREVHPAELDSLVQGAH